MRLQWLVQPRWLLVVVAALALTAWLLWPVPRHQVGAGTYLATCQDKDGKTQFIGVVRVETHPDAWLAAEALHSSPEWAGGTPIPGLGNDAVINADGTVFLFRRDNLTFRYEASLKPPPEMDVPGLQQQSASQFDREVVEGTFDRQTSRRHPRAFLWIQNRAPGWLKIGRDWFEAATKGIGR